MAMGKSFRVFERDYVSTPYSILVEQRNKNTSLLLESDVVAVLSHEEKECIKKQYTKVTDAYGCLGVLQVNSGEETILYLVMVSGCISLGKVTDSEIFRITQTTFIPLKKQPQDDEYISEVRKHLNSGTFYFSWSSYGEPLDISLCAQRRMKTNTTDHRFFWNKTLHLHLLRFGVDCKEWLIKAMCGSVEVRTVYMGHRQGKAVIISRLSNERSGTRFHVRGVNDDGHVANFVETEQAIFVEDYVSSYLQTRGSVPLFWEQTGVQVGQHKVKMSRGSESSQAAFEKHIEMIKERYGHQTFVNLLGTSTVGSKESEGLLSNLYVQALKASKHTDIAHIVFDYHQECRGGNIKNLSKLKEKADPFLKGYGVFFAKGKEVLAEQSGTIRTNCLDCLDRTNCVQTFFGLQVLAMQLELLGLEEKHQSRLEEVFKQMWVDNGNEVSKIYAGTGAIQGGSKLMDGARSAARTIQNNLLDNSKQEAIDILLFGRTINNQTADRARALLDNSMLHVSNTLLAEVCDRFEEYVDIVPIRLAVGTYNVNGGKHFRSVVYKDVSLRDWLLDAHVPLVDSPNHDKPVDLFAIGFEEIVDLNASNIMAASTDNAKAWAEELQKVLSRDRDYVMVTYVQLVGVCLYLFVRHDLAGHLRDLGVDSVKTGLGGATGNKGGVAIRCTFYNTSLCFICAHFAAGQSQVAERNNDYNEISKKLVFPMGATLKSHDYVIWCGDFNYRIDMDKDKLKDLIKEQQWDEILQFDQLVVQKNAGNVFRNCIEGNITFPPTYKYDLFSEDYDTSEKCRAPAWTDRVLWKRRVHNPNNMPARWNPGSLVYYGRAELKQSDHRPVISIIDIDGFQVDTEKRDRVFTEVVIEQGPPDATIILECELEEEDFQSSLVEHFSNYGEIVLMRQVEDKTYITFRDSKSALRAVEAGEAVILEKTFKVSYRCPEWEDKVAEAVRLWKSNCIPLCEYRVPGSLDKPVNLSGRVSPSGGGTPPSRPQLPQRPKVGVYSIPSSPKRPPEPKKEGGPPQAAPPPPPVPPRQAPPPLPSRPKM